MTGIVTGQVVLNGLVTGMVVALPAVALTLIYGILKFPNFAIGAMLTAGAYLALAFNVYLSLPVLYAAAIGAAVFAVMSVGIDQAVFRPLRERGAITLLVASMGVSFVRTSRASSSAMALAASSCRLPGQSSSSVCASTTSRS